MDSITIKSIVSYVSETLMLMTPGSRKILIEKLQWILDQYRINDAKA